MAPIIENPKQLDLPAETTAILQEMFPDYGRVVIKQEFGSGFSGSRVFLARPIRLEDRQDRPELPVVVKLGPTGLIQKEWQAYQNHIRHRLSGIAQMRGEPVLPSGSDWGGLCYPLLGGGTFEVVSLYQYCREASLPDIEFVLNRLLKVVEQMVRLSRPYPEFQLRSSYDRLLPVNLLIVLQTPPVNMRPTVIKPESLPVEAFQPGDFVHLEGFIITEIDPVAQTITLNLPGAAEGPSPSYRLRLQGVEPGGAHHVGQLLPPVEGIVAQTRLSRLQAEAESALGQSIDLTAVTLSWPDGQRLPNPLLRVSALLAETRDVKVGRVHGDLNLENILVDPEVRDVNLIDFSEARRDHVLHDFLYLEMAVLIKLVAEILHRHDLPVRPAISTFLGQLHQATFQTGDSTPSLPHPSLKKPFAILQIIRQTARRYLLDYYDSSEYYQGLTLYLLGALKFKDLNDVSEAPFPKQVAFWGAATLTSFLSGDGVKMTRDIRFVEQRELPISVLSPETASSSPSTEPKQKLLQRITGSLESVRDSKRELRNRQAMLSLVKDFWIRGVLENSLHGTALIALGLEVHPQAVARPWEMVLQTPDVTDYSLPAETQMIEVFDAANGSLLILGDPGAGKTTMLLELARELIERAEQGPDQPMPVVFNLSSWQPARIAGASNPSKVIEAWLVNELRTKYNIPEKIARPWVETDQLALLLDGLDETNPTRREACIQALNDFREKHLVPLVVCSRIADYKALTTRLKLQSAVVLQPLTVEQITRYLEEAGLELAAAHTMLQNDLELQALVQSPLMLNIMTVAYRGLEMEALPPLKSMDTRRKQLFDMYVDRMFTRRGVDHRYSPEQTTEWLSWLAHQMSRHGHTILMIEQLQPSWLSSKTWRWIYILASRMLIAAVIGLIVEGIVRLTGEFILVRIGGLHLVELDYGWLGVMAGLVAGLGVGILDGIRLERNSENTQVRSVAPLWQSLVSILGVGLIFALAFWFVGFGLNRLMVRETSWLNIRLAYLSVGGVMGGLIVGFRRNRLSATRDIQTVEALSWSWSQASKMGIIWLAILFLSSSILWASFGLIINKASLIYDAPVFGLIIGTSGALIGAMFGGVSGRTVIVKTIPNQGMRLSLRNAVLTGLIFCLILGSIFGWGLGLSFGLLAAMWYGGFDLIQHITLRVTLWLKRRVPFNYARFLDFATGRVFLQKVGGGYIFVHRLLLEYFAGLNNK